MSKNPIETFDTAILKDKKPLFNIKTSEEELKIIEEKVRAVEARKKAEAKSTTRNFKTKKFKSRRLIINNLQEKVKSIRLNKILRNLNKKKEILFPTKKCDSILEDINTKKEKTVNNQSNSGNDTTKSSLDISQNSKKHKNRKSKSVSSLNISNSGNKLKKEKKPKKNILQKILSCFLCFNTPKKKIRNTKIKPLKTKPYESFLFS